MSDDPFASPAAAPNLRDRARMSSTFGIIAVVCCLLLPCASCMSLFAAIPLAIAAIQMGRSVLAANTMDEVAEVQARHGMATAVIALSYSGLVLSLVAAYILLYVGVIAMMVVSGL